MVIADNGRCGEDKSSMRRNSPIPHRPRRHHQQQSGEAHGTGPSLLDLLQYIGQLQKLVVVHDLRLARSRAVGQGENLTTSLRFDRFLSHRRDRSCTYGSIPTLIQCARSASSRGFTSASVIGSRRCWRISFTIGLSGFLSRGFT